MRKIKRAAFFISPSLSWKNQDGNLIKTAVNNISNPAITGTILSQWDTTRYEYDDYNRLRKVETPLGDETKIVYEYNGKGQLVYTLDPDRKETEYTYAKCYRFI